MGLAAKCGNTLNVKVEGQDEDEAAKGFGRIFLRQIYNIKNGVAKATPFFLYVKFFDNVKTSSLPSYNTRVIKRNYAQCNTYNRRNKNFVTPVMHNINGASPKNIHITNENT